MSLKQRFLTASSIAFITATASILMGSLAVAQQVAPPAPTTSASQTIILNSTTPAICKLGVADPAATTIAGAMVDLTGSRIGRLRTGLGPYEVKVPGWCNAPSTLTVVAAPMLGPTFVDANNTAAFSRAVNFRARALGWTSAPAAPVTATNATRLGTSQPAIGINAASIPLPTETPITISLDSFSAAADGLLVQGAYSGTVTITLGAN